MSTSDTSRFAQLSPLKRALLAVEEMQARLQAAERRWNEPIAIIGMGCRFPSAPDPSAFWSLLRDGRDAVVEVPASRWNIDDYYDADPDAPGKMSTRWGAFLDQVDQFDAEFFGIAPREAVSMDPQQRLLLEVVWEALENAGQGPRDFQACRTGVFVGLTSDEYAQRFFQGGDDSRFDAYFASGIARSVAGGRISYTLGIEGPNLTFDTACSSSLVAVHTACLYLRMQECRMAVAGGATVILSPQIGVAYSKAHMMAADGRCKAFDSRADGFVRGEGCGMVVLKRLSDALADRDHIVAVIRGSAVNQDGRSGGLTVPNRHAQEAMLRAALAQAGVRPEEIGYVEAHGTGTALGDPIEAHALAAVLGRGRGADNPLVIGSVKTNVGHLEAAAGVAGLIKAVLCLEHGRIAPHLHFERMNPHIDWGGMPVEIPVKGREWRKGGGRRLAGVSSFGFSGTNAHVIVEEAPAAAERAVTVERPLHVLAVSAKSESALRELGSRYAEALEGSRAWLGDICFTANAGRAHFEHRVAAVGGTAEELREGLLAGMPGERVRKRDGLRVGFLFPGQGAQYPGMGKELYETQPVFRAAVDECTDRLGGELETPLREVLWGGASHLLDETAYTQPALFAIEYALAELWRSWGIEPAVVLGHSVGEYAAACVAGVYSLADGLKLIARRAGLMQAVGGDGAMAAVRASEEEVRQALRGLEERLAIAAYNAPENLVISGYAAELAVAEERLRGAGKRVRRLNVLHAFHSPQMASMEAAFEAVAGAIGFAAPRVRVISSVTGAAAGRDEMTTAAYWRRQVRQPVRFQAAIESMQALGCDIFLEVGPGTTLAALGQECIASGAEWLYSLHGKCGEWEQMLNSLGRLYVRGAEVNWTGFDAPYARRRTPLPTYPFERRRYWIEPPRKGRTPAGPGAPEHVPADWYYEISWPPKPIEKSPAPPGCWLVLCENQALAAEIDRAIRGRGGEAVFAAPPDAIADQLRSGKYDVLVCLAAGEECTRDAWAAAQAAAESAQRVRLWLVTTGAQPVRPAEPNVTPAQSPVWGLGRIFACEHPKCWGGLVDLDPQASPRQRAEELVAAIVEGAGEDQAAFRGGRRYVARLVRSAAPPARNPAFAADRSYLITGGLGALGLEAARWMAGHGTRNLALVGRRPPSEQAAAAIEELRRVGVRVGVYSADAGSMPQMEAVFQSLRETMPPVAGVIHAAGVLDDGMLAQQSWDRIRAVMHPKASGAWNLHCLTAGTQLEFFVLFSSLASVAGSAGQAGYAAANAYLDGLAHHRRACGLPAVSINWGGWADVGMAAQAAAQGHLAAEFSLMQPRMALAALGAAIAPGRTQVAIAAVDWSRHTALLASRPFFQELRLEAGAAANDRPAAKPGLRALFDMPVKERQTRLAQNLLQTLARILGVDAAIVESSSPMTDFGLDSLMALEFRNRINAEFGVAIPTVRFLQGLTLEDVAAQIGAAWAEPEGAAAPAVCSRVIEFPLSFGQQVQWFGHKIMPGSPSYNIGLSARARPRLDWGAFERAVAKLTARHAALRTVFFENDAGLPMQRILSSPPPNVELIDASSWSDEQIKEAIREDFGRPLPLERPPFRISVYRSSDGDVLFFKIDHILIDHWSVRLCIDDLQEIYAAELAGREAALAPLEAEYSDFVECETRAVKSAQSEKTWEYWKRKLDSELPVLRLPSSRQRPAVLISHGEAIPLTFTPEHWSGVQRIAREYRATGYSFLLAAFQVLVYHYTGQSDIVVGTSVSGREDPRWANIVGLFINLLALRADLSGRPPFAEYLVRTRDTVFEAMEHQEFPFSLLVTRLRRPRNLERIPVFQCFFNFLTDRSGTARSLFMGVGDAAAGFGGSKLYPFLLMTQQEGRPEVGLQLAEVDGRLVGYLNYNSDVLDPETAEAMAADYGRLLDAILRDPQTPIDDLLAAPAEEPDRETFVL